jgi:hypothetical protein
VPSFGQSLLLVGRLLFERVMGWPLTVAGVTLVSGLDTVIWPLPEASVDRVICVGPE